MRWLLGAVLVVAIAAAATFWFACPCAVVPGGALGGQMVQQAPDDWSFVDDVPLCQLQVQRAIPWSINLNCMSDAGELFVSCSQCEGKRWSAAALQHPDGVLRAGAQLYPVVITRVVAPDQLDRAWAARAAKVGRDTGPRPDHWWSFKLTSR